MNYLLFLKVELIRIKDVISEKYSSEFIIVT